MLRKWFENQRFSNQLPIIDQLLLLYFFRGRNKKKVPNRKVTKTFSILKELYPDSQRFIYLQVLFPKLSYNIVWPLIILSPYIYLFVTDLETLQLTQLILFFTPISLLASFLLFIEVKYGVYFNRSNMEIVDTTRPFDLIFVFSL